VITQDHLYIADENDWYTYYIYKRILWLELNQKVLTVEPNQMVLTVRTQSEGINSKKKMQTWTICDIH
jgi:hypothetical protein